jgi:hypothetical protein
MYFFEEIKGNAGKYDNMNNLLIRLEGIKSNIAIAHERRLYPFRMLNYDKVPEVFRNAVCPKEENEKALQDYEVLRGIYIKIEKLFLQGYFNKSNIKFSKISDEVTDKLLYARFCLAYALMGTEKFAFGTNKPVKIGLSAFATLHIEQLASGKRIQFDKLRSELGDAIRLSQVMDVVDYLVLDNELKNRINLLRKFGIMIGKTKTKLISGKEVFEIGAMFANKKH